MWNKSLCCLFFIVVASACTVENPYSELALSGAMKPECESETARFSSEPMPLVNLNALDILMVIDSGPDAGPLQESLSEAMPDFIAALNASDTPDWQLAVVPADITNEDERGSLSSGQTAGSECRRLGVDYILNPNTPSVAERAACLVQTGTSGIGGRQIFNAGQFAIFNALDPASHFYARNSPLLRDNVPLAIIIVSAHEDCSGQMLRDEPRCGGRAADDLESIGRYSNFFFQDVLRVREMSRSGMRVFVIGGSNRAINDDGLSCSSAFDVYSAPRLHSFVDTNYPEAAAFNACGPSLDRPLRDIVDTQLTNSNIRYCASAQVVEGTRVVRATNEDGYTILPSGAWTLTRPNSSCPNGAFEISREALREADASGVELLYCAQPRAH